MINKNSAHNYKAIFADLDGTTIPNASDALPSARVIEAIKRAQETAIVSIATGRPLWLCQHIFDMLKITSPCIVDGGSQIVNPLTKEILWEQPLSDETIEKIKTVCSPYKYIDKQNKSTPQLQTPYFTGSQRKMVLVGFEQAELTVLIDQLKLIPEVNVFTAQSWEKGKWDAHISHIGASKRHALEVLLGILDLEAHEVIGIGDSQNDEPLLEAAGFKVAMGNATDDLKAKADYIAPTVGEDGLAEVIEKFIL